MSICSNGTLSTSWTQSHVIIFIRGLKFNKWKQSKVTSTSQFTISCFSWIVSDNIQIHKSVKDIYQHLLGERINLSKLRWFIVQCKSYSKVRSKSVLIFLFLFINQVITSCKSTFPGMTTCGIHCKLHTIKWGPSPNRQWPELHSHFNQVTRISSFAMTYIII